MIHPFRWLLLVCVLLVPARADFAKDLARIHAEATGGREAINRLRSLRATGVTRSELGDSRFLMVARRPDLLRIEITMGERTVVQCWDGKTEPWIADSRTRRIVMMGVTTAEAFKTEAEFDDPLLAGPGRKISLDYAGEVETETGKLIKILVTQNFTTTSFVYLDPATYLIVRRDVVRRMREGEAVLRTVYSDFKPVAGVLLPHRLVVTQNGKRLRETIIERMEANPELPAGVFSLPANPAGKKS